MQSAYICCTCQFYLCPPLAPQRIHFNQTWRQLACSPAAPGIASACLQFALDKLFLFLPKPDGRKTFSQYLAMITFSPSGFIYIQIELSSVFSLFSYKGIGFLQHLVTAFSLNYLASAERPEYFSIITDHLFPSAGWAFMILSNCHCIILWQTQWHGFFMNKKYSKIFCSIFNGTS